MFGRLALLAVLAAALTACGSAQTTGTPGVLQVVAAESVWGSIAAQVGGPRVHVTSIISNPATDPHAYEPTAADARAVASATLVWYNGVGYDAWMPKLVAVDPGLTVLDVGRVVGATSGGNPHQWYNPGDVRAAVAAYVADLARLEPAHAANFRARAVAFETSGLATYHRLIASIRARYGGTPVGASESIFSMLAPSLGLDVLTPYSFLRAVSEGTDVSAADKATIDSQIRQHRIDAYIYNSQNTTPDVQAQLAECRAVGIPTATITETLVPVGATYQAWQVAQLRGIEAALAKGTRR